MQSDKGENQKAEVSSLARSVLGTSPLFFNLTSFPLETGADGETRTLAGRTARQFTKLLLSLLSHAGKKWWAATVLPRALRFKGPLHRCNACNPNATRRRS